MSETPVLKFGGTSLQGKARFGAHEHRLLEQCRALREVNDIYRLLAQRRNSARAHRLHEVARDFILPWLDKGLVPVVVVSAFDWATDKLDQLAAAIAAEPPPREYARLLMSGELRANTALAMTLEHMGCAARSMTGREAGIVTRLGNTEYGPAVDAMIQTVHEGYLLELATQGIIPVVAGFQGYFNDPETGRDEVSILARGGSNLTAVALADALGEDECTMFSDIDGVYTAPPDEDPNAEKFDVVPARKLFELPKFPKVIQQEALAYAVYRNIDIWIRSGFDPNMPGTKIICKGEWDYIPEDYKAIVLGTAVSRAKDDNGES